MGAKRRKVKESHFPATRDLGAKSLLDRSALIRLLLARSVVLRLPHLAKFGRSFHQSPLSMFAVFMRCRPIPQRVDRVTGHSGSLFSASTRFFRFRRHCGTVQTKFREADNCLGAADRAGLTGDPAINAFEQVARQRDSYRSLSRFRRGRLTRRHVVLRVLNSGQDISSTHEKSPAAGRASSPQRIP